MSTLSAPASLELCLPDVYRFAFLMTGESAAAAAVLRRTVERAMREGIGENRDTRRVRRWLFIEARHQCAQPTAAPPTPAAADHPHDSATPAQLATRFARVPAAERGALILFYLYLFDPADLADVLEIPPAELAPLLDRGRASLREGA